MNKKRKAFTIIEVIIATSILTIAVFGVYKLIGENTKLIHNSNRHLSGVSLFPIISECLEYYGFNNFSSQSPGDNTNIYLGNGLQGCQLISSGNIIDNIEYRLSSEIINIGSDFINWNISIESDGIKTLTGEYLQIKR